MGHLGEGCLRVAQQQVGERHTVAYRAAKRIRTDPRVQVVINMDGWVPPWMKRESYRRYVARYPVEYTGFKLFYRNDTRDGERLMRPADVLALKPRPIYIQYQ